jgi:hypothetical protein
MLKMLRLLVFLSTACLAVNQDFAGVKSRGPTASAPCLLKRDESAQHNQKTGRHKRRRHRQMARQTTAGEGSVKQINGQRTPPMNEPLDPRLEGQQHINSNNTGEPKPKPSQPGTKNKRRVRPMRIPPDIIP